MKKMIIIIHCVLWFIIDRSWALIPEKTPSIESSEEGSTVPRVYVFIFAGLLSGTIFKLLIKKFQLRISYLIVVLGMGMLLGVLNIYVPQTMPYFVLTGIESREFMAFSLPILLFKVAFCIDVHTFVRAQSQIILISIPVVILSACMMGLLMGIIIDSSWRIEYKFLLGVLCTPIHAVAMESFLKDQSVQTKHTQTLLEGESMLGLVTIETLYWLIKMSTIGNSQHWYEWLKPVSGNAISTAIGLVSGYLGQLILRNFPEFQTILAATIIMPFMTYFIVCQLLQGSGCFAVLIVGVMMGVARTSIPKEMEQYVKRFWDHLAHTVHTLIFLEIGVIFVTDIARDMEGKDYALILVTYLVSLLSRFMSFLIFSPILTRISYGMTFSQMVFLVCGGLKGSFNLIYAYDVYHKGALSDAFHQNVARIVYMHIVGLVIMNLLVNLPVLPILFRIAGWANISLARETNMNNCLKHIQIARERAIAILKMDRFLADANWPMVQTTTTLKHPYKIKIDESNRQQLDDFFMGYRYGFCTDCKKEVLNDPTPKELKEMMREARMRILKAQKIFYFRQFENGMLSLSGLRVLSQAVEMAMDSSQAIIELDGLFKMFKKKTCAFCLRNYFVSILYRDRLLLPPKRYWRRIFYNWVTSKPFKIFIYVSVLLSLVPIILGFVFLPPMSSPFGITLMCSNVIFYLIFLSEFAMKIYAYSSRYIFKDGFRIYFKSGWNIFDFVILVCQTIEMMIEIAWEFFDISKDHETLIVGLLRSVRLLRGIKLLQALELYASEMTALMNRRIDKNVLFAYEIGKAFVTAQEEVLEMLPYMIDYVRIKDEMKQKMEEDRLAVSKQLGMVQKDRPWIAITVKTKQAMTTVLNHIKDSINELKVSGWADEVESSKLAESLDKCHRFVRAIKHIQPCPPRVIFREVSWLAGDDKVIDYLYDNIATKKFDPGDYVCKEGEISEGIFVVITGLLLIRFVPQAEMLTEMALYGKLPIVDYVTSHKFDSVTEEYVGPGNTFGELGTLTDRVYCSSIRADTHSQVLVMNREFVKTAMYLSPDPSNGLECRLWKAVSIRLATSVLMEVPAYQGATKNKVRFALERAFVPNLSMFKSLIVNGLMKDVVLIEGVVIDGTTRDAYVAPKYIPRTVGKLLLPGHEQFNILTNTRSKLMIIPIKDVDELEVMAGADQMAELMSITSDNSKCLQHTIISRRASIYKRKVKYSADFPAQSGAATNMVERLRETSGTSSLRGSRLDQNWSKSSYKSSELDDGSLGIFSASFERIDERRRRKDADEKDENIWK